MNRNTLVANIRRAAAELKLGYRPLCQEVVGNNSLQPGSPFFKALIVVQLPY